MLARIRSAAVLGVEAYPVDVEVDLSTGLPTFATVGLAQGAVREGRERVHAALVNAGFEFPLRRITVNLAPADIHKSGSAFDLPIALGLLVASGQLPAEGLAGHLVVGELGLEGALRPVRGALPLTLAARAAGCRGVLLPVANLPEAAVVAGIEVRGAATLAELCHHLRGTVPLPVRRDDPAALLAARPSDRVDLSDVRGQAGAKRALEVAAAGGHNLVLMGPPGAGKTMLARRLPTILPGFSLEEALESTAVHSVAGLLPPGTSVLTHRPFRAPHHTVSEVGLIGGGVPPRPGEVSLAHGGVLFLDELPEFRRGALEVLRQPLEDGAVSLTRGTMSLSYPARFMLVAALNPCPCGWLGDPVHDCRCGTVAVARYRDRISGPLLDRIDIHLVVPGVPWRALASGAEAGETSAVVRERVEVARRIQRDRFADRRWIRCNAQVGSREMRQHCRQSEPVEALIRAAMTRLGLSARAWGRVLKLSRTIADLAGCRDIQPEHAAEAIQYRSLDRRSAGVR